MSATNSRSQKALRAFVPSVVARGLRAAARIGILLLAARFYSVGDIGHFAYLLALGGILSIVFDAGITNYLAREVAARGFRAIELERLALRIRVIGTPVAIACAWALARVGDPFMGLAGLCTLSFAATISLADFLATRQRAHGRFRAEIIEMLPTLWGPLLLASFCAWKGASFASFQVTLGVSGIICVALRVWRMHRSLPRTHDQDSYGSTRHLLWQCRWFLLASIGGWALFEAANLILKSLASPEAVAMYASALRPIGIVSHPFMVLGQVFIPSLSFERLGDPRQFAISVRNMNRASVALMPAGFASAVLGGRLLLRLFGSEYLAAMPLVWILGIGSVFYFGVAKPAALIAKGAERMLSLVSLASAIIVAAIGIILIPDHGAEGAAIAVFVALVAAKLAHIAGYRAHGLPGLSGLECILLVGTAGWILLACGLPSHWDTWLLALGGAISVIGTLWLLRQAPLFGTNTLSPESCNEPGR